MIEINIINKGSLSIKTWATKIENGAMEQAINLAKLPFAFRHIALMADVHEGYGMPIGGVLATEGVIIPNAVGVDIGCGVIALKTDVKKVTEGQIKEVLGKIRGVIPVGFKHHQKPQEWKGFDQAPKIKIIQQELASAQCQLGTLGGGNHFIELQKGNDGHIWLMIHSGSRNIGLKVAKHYNQLAKKMNQKAIIQVPKEHDLAYLPLDSMEGEEYLAAMNFCLEFAKANREMMAEKLYRAFAGVTASAKILETIHIHHNYAAKEIHFNREVIVHRKGAISAQQGQLGIIPGSMGTPSYITEGLGNPESFMSCSHGAGRTMSRKKANQTINEETANQSMAGIVFGNWHGDYSECPLAYKNIQEVMNNQLDLVKPLVELSPLGVMKG